MQTVRRKYEHKYIPSHSHRRRKILSVGGAEHTVVHAARTKFFRPHPLSVKPRPFLYDRGCCELLSQCNQEFLDERTNSKSSRVDLAATNILTHNQA